MHCIIYELEISWEKNFAAILQPVKSAKIFNLENFRLYSNLRKTVSHPDHIRLSVGARSDLAWWHFFLESWNHISLMTAANRITPDITLTSDTSGAWGCGGYWGDKWFQLAWEDTQCSPSTNITVKFIPIVIAAAVWEREWQGKVVGCKCENQAVVAVLLSHKQGA